MGKTTGFLEFERTERGYIKPEERLKNYREYVTPLPGAELTKQAARCMNCGIPYCHNGCPVNNMIPDWNDLVYRDQWQAALETLHSTNNFPEFTGRICPAPCEASCTLNITETPVTIKSIECAIVDRGWEEGWIGLLRYGIPDFKMEKHLIDRRVDQMAAEGVEFRTGTEVGSTLPFDVLLAGYDAVVMTGGAEWPRELEVDGRNLSGIYPAMDYLTQQNKRVAGDTEDRAAPRGTISAKGKHVIVIGGGDTGADCIGTAARQGAASITQIEIMPKPPEQENKGLTWPNWPHKLRTAPAHYEGCARDWAVLTKQAVGENGRVTALDCVRVEWVHEAGRMQMREVAGSGFQMKADLVLLAMGFLGPRRAGLLETSGVALDARGNVQADTEAYQTSVPKVFAAGDMRRGQSLVVWAIREGRQCARAVDEFLMGVSTLPR